MLQEGSCFPERLRGQMLQQTVDGLAHDIYRDGIGMFVGLKMNSKQFETAKMCLKVVTPVNISDGIVLGAKDYLYDSRRQKVFFLNLHQWHMFIYKHMLLEKYESHLANFRDKQSLLEWLQMQGYDIDDVRTVITSEAQATVNLMDNEKRKHSMILTDIFSSLMEVYMFREAV